MLSPTRRFRPDTPFADLARIRSLCELSKSTKKIDIAGQGCIGDTTGPQYNRATIQPSFKAQTAALRSIVAIPERPLFLFEILIGLLGAHSIAAIHGERNEHTCHNREIECKETPNER